MNVLKDLNTFAELLAVEAFASLLSSMCLEPDLGTEGLSFDARRFRASWNVDIHIRNSSEPAVLNAVEKYQHTSDISARAGRTIATNTPATARRIRLADRNVELHTLPDRMHNNLRCIQEGYHASGSTGRVANSV